jgi:hypothetical protein
MKPNTVILGFYDEKKVPTFQKPTGARSKEILHALSKFKVYFKEQYNFVFFSFE